MRSISRFLLRLGAKMRHRPRYRAIRSEMEEVLGHKILLKRAGARGRDDIFLIISQTNVLGVLRLINPYIRSQPLLPEMPFQITDHQSRLEREWNCYRIGSQYGLTPSPLWRCQDALLCSYIDGARLHDHLLADATVFWHLMIDGTRTLHNLHKVGMTHMDASLANMIKTQKSRTQAIVIDFEYVPHHQLSFAQQCAYDYLRLLESSYKFLPKNQVGQYKDWIACLDDCIDHETRATSLAPLAPAIARILNDKTLRTALTQIFQDKQTLLHSEYKLCA